MAVLGWAAGTRVRFDDNGHGVVVVQESAVGQAALTNRAMVTIPSHVRRRCGFVDREQVLLVAEPRLRVLLVLGFDVMEQALPDAGDVLAAVSSAGIAQSEAEDE